ncbi:MAG TPA: hypothetical protein VNO14_07965 [Blastocatellia bacterium]|nr:hypothetical protein [Blastocatellia bacterium]
MSEDALRYGESTRRLVLALDGVPWQAIDESRSGGRFRVFHPPARVISPFPTMTNIGMNAMLGARKPLGYENLYFDRARGRMCGGSMKYIKRRSEDPDRRGYNHLLDYEEPMQFEFLVYVFPGRIFSADLSKLLDAFKRSRAPAFYAFLKSTDGVIHIGGREKLMPVLAELDAALSQLYEDHKGELEILLYSDHGNALLPFKRVSMKTHLAAHGFEPSSRVSSRRSVIIPGFGLCSYAPIYTTPESRREIAEALSTLTGVDFSVFRPLDDDSANGGGVTELIGSRGRARIHYDAHSRAFRYERIEGDPLALAAAVAELEASGSIDGRGYAPDSAWFEATRDHTYPDALRNIWSSVREHVESTADILVSFEDGYCYGSAVFDRLVSLAATHGSALRSTSFAFLMSTHRGYPDCLRAVEARDFLRN